MKKINLKIITLVILTLTPFIGCSEDELNQPNLNAFSDGDFWKTEEDAERGILGAYSVFQQITYYRRFEIFLSDYRDDVINPFNTSDRTAAANFNAISTGNPVRWLYQSIFAGIFRANKVLENVPNIEMSNTIKNNILGEAYFIRGYNNFQAVANFLNVALITDTQKAIDPSTVSQEDPRVVMNQVIEDFKKASELLPDTRDNKNLGRVTKASALAYLGKAYLYEASPGFGKDPSKYALAADALKKVIDNPNYGLVDNYADNFKSTTENNKESLFELQYNLVNGQAGWTADRPNSGTQNAFTPDIAAPTFSGQDSMNVNPWLLDLYTQELTNDGKIDPRALTTLFFDPDNMPNGRTMDAGQKADFLYYEGKTYKEAFPTGNDIFGRKYLEVELFNLSNFNQSSNNLRLMRYADVLLMYAEAKFMSNGGSADQAVVDAVNEVRQRVNMPDADLTITMKEIEEERIKELTFERTRYFDLLRWGKVKERIVDNPQFKSNSAGTEAYKPGREYLSIPQNELDLAPNFMPNPGY